MTDTLFVFVVVPRVCLFLSIFSLIKNDGPIMLEKQYFQIFCFLPHKKKKSNMIIRTIVLLLFTISTCSYGNILGDHLLEGNENIYGGSYIDYEDKSDHPISLHGVAPSPKCWQSSVILFHFHNENDSITDARKLCAIMPDEYQKRLALEIANCHLNDLGKKLYRTGTMNTECGNMSIANDDDSISVLKCLKYLTPAGEHAYTIYITYVQHLCIRLTQEMLLLYQEETRQELAWQHEKLSKQSIEHLHSLQDLSIQYVHQMSELTLIPEKIKNQLETTLTNQVKETLHQSLHLELKEQLSIQLKDQLEPGLQTVLQKHVHEQEQYWNFMLDKIEQRDDITKQKMDDWTHFQITVWHQHAHEMELQHEKLMEHRKQIETLSESVQLTNQQLDPFVRIKKVIQLASTWYHWIEFFAYFVAIWSIIWFITKLPRCKCARPYLYSIVMVAGLLELLLRYATERNIVTDAVRIQYMTELRRFVIILGCLVYTIILVSSFFVGKNSTKQCQERKHEEYYSATQQPRYVHTIGDASGSSQRYLNSEFMDNDFKYLMQNNRTYADRSQDDNQFVYRTTQSTNSHVPSTRHGAYVTTQSTNSHVPGTHHGAYVTTQATNSYDPIIRHAAVQRDNQSLPVFVDSHPPKLQWSNDVVAVCKPAHPNEIVSPESGPVETSRFLHSPLPVSLRDSIHLNPLTVNLNEEFYDASSFQVISNVQPQLNDMVAPNERKRVRDWDNESEKENDMRRHESFPRTENNDCNGEQTEDK